MTGPWIAAFVAQWIISAILALTQLGVLRRVLPALSGLPPEPSALEPGMALPEFAATWPGGASASPADLIGQPLMLLFVSRTCTPCHRLLHQLHGSELLDGVVPVIAVADVHDLAHLPLPPGMAVLHEHAGSVSLPFGVVVTPLAVTLDRGGAVVETRVPGDVGDLHRMVKAVLTTRNHEQAARGGPNSTFTAHSVNTRQEGATR